MVCTQLENLLILLVKRFVYKLIFELFKIRLKIYYKKYIICCKTVEEFRTVFKLFSNDSRKSSKYFKNLNS